MIVPFVGSGTECLAAFMEGRKFLGYEINPDYIAIANDRIKQWENQMPIFHSQDNQDQ